MALFDAIRAGASGAVQGYKVERSLRFGEDDSRLRIGQASGNQKIFTFSVWLKRSTVGSGTSTISSATFNVGGQFGFYFLSSDQLQVREYNGQSNSETIDIRTSRVFRDISSWFHLVVAIDTTQGTSTNRAKVYVNGEQVTDFSTTSFPSQNQNFMVNSNYDNQRFHIGVENYAGTTNEFKGYIAEYNFIDGQQLAPSNFGETDSNTGQWVPIDTSGLTFGTNGFYLNFSDNSGTTSTTLGKDYSGNSNNFTPNNFSVAAGENNDSVEDTPTNNWCTFNALDPSATGNFSNGNLYAVCSTGFMAGSNFVVTSGKWYMEVKYVSGTSNHQWSIGFSSPDRSYVRQVRGGDGELTPNTGNVSVTFSDPDVIMLALDVDNGKWYIGKNGSYMLSGDPVNGTGFVHSGLSSSDGFMLCCTNNTGDGSQTIAANFGQQGFTYTPPTNFKALNSANLPDPTILLPNKHFDSKLINGTGSQQTITGYNFSPSWVWGKQRSATNSHEIYDVIRGVLKIIYSDLTDAEGTNNNGISAFTSDGYTIAGNTSLNQSSNTAVGWAWNAGGSTVTNSSGTISAQVRANASAGFSIISYTGNATSGATVGHGLGVAPSVLIGKNRSSAANWGVWHKEIPINYHLILNGGQASSVYTGFYNNTLPSSTLVTLGNDLVTNGNGNSIILYCFSEVAGYSKFGSYTGNGNADGTFVFTGFRPAWVMMKRTDSGGNWFIIDNKRDTFNEVTKDLYPNTAGTETDNPSFLDFLSNGFKLRTVGTAVNAGTIIYLAFAEAPFKNARAR